MLGFFNNLWSYHGEYHAEVENNGVVSLSDIILVPTEEFTKQLRVDNRHHVEI